MPALQAFLIRPIKVARTNHLPPRPDLAHTALGRHHAAALADPNWNAGLRLRAKPGAATAGATDAQILDIVGAPELRGDKQL